MRPLGALFLLAVSCSAEQPPAGSRDDTVGSSQRTQPAVAAPSPDHKQTRPAPSPEAIRPDRINDAGSASTRALAVASAERLCRTLTAGGRIASLADPASPLQYSLTCGVGDAEVSAVELEPHLRALVGVTCSRVLTEESPVSNGGRSGWYALWGDNDPSRFEVRYVGARRGSRGEGAVFFFRIVDNQPALTGISAGHCPLPD
jgi:hypothetical protein